MRKQRTVLFSVVISLGVAFLALVFIEGALRLIGGYPRGTFAFTVFPRTSLYPPNAVLNMSWGPVPYTVRTNSLGFRGKETATDKSAGIVRIAALGDSATDGFFVDDGDTFPALLDQELAAKGLSTEVINAARGGGSIDKEFAIFRQFVIPLRPDVAILTFVTNDIADIAGKSREELLAGPPDTSRDTVQFLITGTALGEFLYDRFLRARYPEYRAAEARKGRADRYAIPRGNEFQRNVQAFRAFTPEDFIVLDEPFTKETEELVSRYLWMLGLFKSFAELHECTLVFVYFPAYSQVYDTAASMRIARILEQTCSRMAIPFLDLTPAFRQAGQNVVLHLAPVDFHLNPAGNRAMAKAVADFLESGVLKNLAMGEAAKRAGEASTRRPR